MEQRTAASSFFVRIFSCGIARIFLLAIAFSALSGLLPNALPAQTSRSPRTLRPILSMSFAGDIMAHDSNFKMQDFSRIYKRVLPLLQDTQLNFANLEFVIDDQRPYSTYPVFNVHTEYVEAAIAAGFNIFSLANNHSCDFGLSGVRATAQSSEKLRQKYPALHFSGLRGSSQKADSFLMQSIDYNGWHIGFTALSILSNSPKGAKAVQYIAANDSRKLKLFYRWLEQQRPDFDLVVVSVHGGVEYQLQASRQKQQIFRQLARSGADIVWGQHPHVQQPWEIYQHGDSKQRSWSLIMYSQGNFISAQTIRAKPTEPNGSWAATGDFVLLQVQLQRGTDGNLQLVGLKPLLMSTIRLKPFAFAVVPMREAAAEMRRQGYTGWDNFYAVRQKLLEQRVAQWPQLGPQIGS